MSIVSLRNGVPSIYGKPAVPRPSSPENPCDVTATHPARSVQAVLRRPTLYFWPYWSRAASRRQERGEERHQRGDGHRRDDNEQSQQADEAEIREAGCCVHNNVSFTHSVRQDMCQRGRH